MSICLPLLGIATSYDENPAIYLHLKKKIVLHDKIKVVLHEGPKTYIFIVRAALSSCSNILDFFMQHYLRAALFPSSEQKTNKCSYRPGSTLVQLSACYGRNTTFFAAIILERSCWDTPSFFKHPNIFACKLQRKSKGYYLEVVQVTRAMTTLLRFQRFCKNVFYFEREG